jgi:hypothetical protein
MDSTNVMCNLFKKKDLVCGEKVKKKKKMKFSSQVNFF